MVREGELVGGSVGCALRPGVVENRFLWQVFMLRDSSVL